MTKDEVLKLALDALEVAVWRFGGSDAPRRAITAIKAALAQPAEREWVGLTDEEMRECYEHVEGVTVSEAVILMSVIRTTQASLKGKNT